MMAVRLLGGGFSGVARLSSHSGAVAISRETLKVSPQTLRPGGVILGKDDHVVTESDARQPGPWHQNTLP